MLVSDKTLRELIRRESSASKRDPIATGPTHYDDNAGGSDTSMTPQLINIYINCDTTDVTQFHQSQVNLASTAETNNLVT